MSYRSFVQFSADSPHQASAVHNPPWRNPPVLNDLETAVTCQPRTRRANKSITKAVYTQPENVWT